MNKESEEAFLGIEHVFTASRARPGMSAVVLRWTRLRIVAELARELPELSGHIARWRAPYIDVELPLAAPY